MTDSIIELIETYPDAIAKTVNMTFEKMSQNGQSYRVGDPDPALNKYIPMTRYLSSKLTFRKFNEAKPTLAFIVGIDGEYPIRKEAFSLSLESIGSAKLARSRLLTEEDFDILREADLHLRANEPDLYNELVKGFLQIPAYLTQSVVRLCAVLLIQIYFGGIVTYIDPETKLGFELSYLSSVPVGNNPLPLTGANLWSAGTTAKPLETLRDHLNVYYGNCNRFPDDIGMSATVSDYLLSAQDTRVKIAAMKGIYNAPDVALLPRVALDDVKQWLTFNLTSAIQTSNRLPGFIITDAVYFTTDPITGLEVSRPYLPSDGYCFMVEGIVEGAYVPTATNNYQQTLAIVTEPISLAPKREKVSIDTRVLAACYDSRFLGWRKVI